jgi:hypothetical protein
MKMLAVHERDSSGLTIMHCERCKKDFTIRDVNDKRMKAQVEPLKPS